MGPASVRRQLSVIGLIGVLVALVAQLLVAGAPAADQPASATRDWFINHRGLALAAGYMAALGLTLHLSVVVAVRDRLRAAEGRGATISGLIVPATVLWLGVVMVGVASFAAAAYNPSGMSAETSRELFDAAYLAFGASGFGTALALACASWVVLRTRAFPAWFGWFGAFAAVLHLVGAAALARSGTATPENGSLVAVVYYAWIATATVLIWRKPLADAEAA